MIRKHPPQLRRVFCCLYMLLIERAARRGGEGTGEKQHDQIRRSQYQLAQSRKEESGAKAVQVAARRISSPAYMAAVTATATSTGTRTDTFRGLPSRNEPTKTPMVTPSSTKKRAISVAERGETVISPVR